MVRFDDERDEAKEKPGYPDAHIQVYPFPTPATPPGAWCDALLAAGTKSKGKAFGKLHVPTGHKTFRPIPEDIAEFLIVEKLATAKPGWKAAVTKGRNDFHRRQLKAMLRADPATARALVAELKLT